MKKLLPFLMLAFLAACSSKEDIPDVLERSYQIKTVSDSASSAQIDFEENRYKEILVLFHYGFSEDEIKKYFEIGDSVFNERINTLYGSGLIKKNAEGFWLPAFPVIDSKDDAEILKQADSLGIVFADIIIDRLEKIKNEYGGILSLKNIPFENESLMILSGVMLNGEQIKNIEMNFIRDDKPLRGGSRFYMAAFENTRGPGVQPYGMNEFTVFTRGDSILCYYGDTKNPQTVNTKLPVLSRSDFGSMMKISEVISEDLLGNLNERRPLLVKGYLNSGLKEQASFKEYFFWLYKLAAQRATGILIQKKYISVPEGGSNQVVIAAK